MTAVRRTSEQIPLRGAMDFGRSERQAPVSTKNLVPERKSERKKTLGTTEVTAMGGDLTGRFLARNKGLDISWL